ncbi:hypothetical protein V8C86DRAFT_2712814 [Haematococcus lacustris]
MASDEFDTSSLSTPSLAAYLGWHILKKGFQAGGILAVPLAPLVQYVRQRKLVVGAVLTTAGVTVAGATALTAALGAARFTQLDRDGFADRCYRLYFNEGQRRTDLFSGAGAAGGLALTWAMARPALPLQLVGGAALGNAVGVALHLASQPQSQRTANQALTIIRDEASGA